MNPGFPLQDRLKQLCDFGKLLTIVSLGVSLAVPKADGKDSVGFVLRNQGDLIHKSGLFLQDWDRLVFDDSV
jgi:hypothetical protein